MENTTIDITQKQCENIKNIFVSYGRDEYVGFVQQVVEKLRERGHNVWFDTERLQLGKNWEEQIEKGIDFVSEDKTKGTFLLIMTPHSVRRPDGYCLNELARALERKISVIPVMLVESVPPLSICRIQYLDLINLAKSFSDSNTNDTNTFENIFLKICNGIENNILDQEAVISSLYHELNPLGFNAEISFHQPNFTGRNWIFEQINAWIFNEERTTRFLAIIGGPGVGKSAISSKLLSNFPSIKAFHFCRRGHSEKSSFRRAICTLAYQLSTQIPKYKEKIIGINIKQELLRLNEVALFDLLLTQPLNSIVRKKEDKLVFLIDGLDESHIDRNNDFSKLLYSEFSKLNQDISFIFTTRTDDECLSYFLNYDSINIENSSEENISDLSEYINKMFSIVNADYNNKIHSIKSSVLENSSGSFLYAKYICEKIKTEHDIENFEISNYEKDIYSIYLDYFYNKFSDDTYYRENISPALEILLASFEPLSKNEYKIILGWNNYKINDFISDMASFIKITDDNKIIPFHTTLLDWLEDRNKNKKFWIDKEEGSEKIFSVLWNIFEDCKYSFWYEGILDNYLIRYLPKLMKYNKRKISFSNILEKLSPELTRYHPYDFAIYHNERFVFLIEMFTYFIKNDDAFYIDFKLANEEKAFHLSSLSHLRGITFLYNKIKGNDILNKQEEAFWSDKHFHNKYYYFLDVNIPQVYISNVDTEIIASGLLNGLDGAIDDGRVSTIPIIAKTYVDFLFKLNINNRAYIKKNLQELLHKYRDNKWGFNIMQQFLIDYANKNILNLEKKFLDDCFDFLDREY